MATNTNIDTPDLATLVDVKLSTPEINEIMDTWRSDIRYTPDINTYSASSTSSCVATPKPVSAAAKQPHIKNSTTAGFLSQFEQSVQDAASALGVDEQNFHKMTDDDLRALHPSLAVQFNLRELRDKKKAEHRDNEVTRLPETQMPVQPIPPPQPVCLPQETPNPTPDQAAPVSIWTAVQRRTAANQPSATELLQFCSNLDMNPMERLKPIANDPQIAEFRVNTVERMERLTRTRITRQYVRYVFGENVRRFKSTHPTAEVMSYTATKLAEYFPAMRDYDTTREKPTYNELFVRYPIGGSVYECFKNSNRGQPEEYRIRKRKAPAAATAAATPDPEPEPVPQKKMPESYEELVKELETADPERTEEILVQTFDERRKWVTGDNGPKITEVLGAYPVFHTDNDQIKKEFSRVVGDDQPAQGFKRLQTLLDTIKKQGPEEKVVGLLKKTGIPKVAELVPHILVKDDETKVANQTGGVVGALNNNKLSVCIHGGFFIPVQDVTEMLGMMVIMHYILHISPPAQVLAAYGVMCRLFGDTTNEIKLSKMQKELVGKFK